MRCPNCKDQEMEKGWFSYGYWISESNGFGQLGKFGSAFSAALVRGKGVIAYRCPKCGKIELSSEID